MIQSFRDPGTEDVWNGRNTRRARNALPRELWRSAQRKLTLLNHATGPGDLAAVPSLRLKTMRGDRKGQHSIRVDEQYRICFEWTDAGPRSVELVDYH